jgi:hypothetical protein
VKICDTALVRRSLGRGAVALCLSIVAAFQWRLAAAGGVSQDVPVPGGTVAMAQSLGITPSPDRARFVAELARLTHQTAEGQHTTRAKAASMLRRSAGGAFPRGSTETVPIPLSVGLWSDAVFHHPVAPEEIVAAIVADPRAAHLCYGLAALDDETLQFFADHPAAVTQLYERSASAFAAFGDSLRIHDNRVQPPGGPAAAELWEAAVGEKLARPQPFVRALFAQDQGRLAYLYNTIDELDAPRAAFALGLWIKEPAARLRRFTALVAANRGAIPQWEPARLPFTRPLHDVSSILMRVLVEPDGAPSFPSQRSVWTWAFDGVDVPATAPRALTSANDGPIDAGWLAQMIVAAETRFRGERLDQLTVGQRVFHGADPATMGDVLTAIRAFPRFRMLMLTLERMGVVRASVLAAAARRAQQLSTLEHRRAVVALGQFQGALALVARMTSVRTLDGASAESLVTSLVNTPVNHDGRYAGALGKWMQQQLRPALPEGDDLESAVLAAVAGRSAGQSDAAAAVMWEGNAYRLDIAAADRRRLGRIREKQGGPSLDAAVSGSDDEVLADVLVAWTYAVSIGDAESPVLLTGRVTRRHDFGLGAAERGQGGRTIWALPRQEIAVGVPWHVVGSLLGLDVALSGLALRRVSGDRAIDAPTLSTNERDAFATTVALLNPFDLRDRDRDLIAVAIERGRTRVAALAEDSALLSELASEIRMDGWRTRALQWTIAHDPERIASMFSMTELLSLGRGPLADLAPWGTSALVSSGCLCTRMAPANQWRLMTGRPQLGLMAETVADLNLHIAVILRDLRLPAAVAKAVLSAAVQDFIDEARPTDFNDWLTLVRTAQNVPRERIEDYVAVATSDGPLVPQQP